MAGIHKAVRQVRRHIKALTSDSLTRYFAFLGFTVVEFEDESDEIVRSCGLADYAKGKNAFLHSTPMANIVFIRVGLSDNEAVFLLLHEAGHILLGHKIGGVSQDDEIEASRFALSCIRRYRLCERKGKIILICLTILLAAAVAFVPHWNNRGGTSSSRAEIVSWFAAATGQGALRQAEKVYITANGDKYHSIDCQYIRGKDNLIELSLEEALSAGKTPCKVCIK